MYLRIEKLQIIMQKRIVLFIAISITLLGCKEVKEEQKVAPEAIAVEAEEASKSVYEDLEGNPIELADYKGKRILLNYWATWCRPCIEEMPALLKLQGVLEQENYVFLFASDQTVKKISAFKEARGFDFKYIKYNGTYAEQKINALPVTLIYNEAGEQVSRFDGGMTWDSPEMIEQLRKIH
tara:strand:- start:1838 stop:2380 length:543 start_codon:yes stop_codon:yes gene_type:complete